MVGEGEWWQVRWLQLRISSGRQRQVVAAKGRCWQVRASGGWLQQSEAWSKILV